MGNSGLRKASIMDTIIIIILLAAMISCLMPIINAVSISLSDKTSAQLGQVTFWPKNFTLAAYAALWEEKQFFVSFGNSVVRVLLGSTINVLLCITMGYALSKSTKEFHFRNVYMWVVIATMLFNGGLVPTFLIIKKLHLIDTIWALVLPGAVPIFSMIILMNFFRGIPKALEEAAMVDGANPLYIMWNIFVPLAMPAIATITLFSVVDHWNAFFDAKLYINSPAKLPLQTYIQSLTVDLHKQTENMTYDQILRMQKMSNLTFNSAKIVVSMVPILLIYPFLQRYFVSGIVMGAVKE